MPPTPQSQKWPADRAVLFVHGIGNSSKGAYDAMVAEVQDMLGDDRDRFAWYFLYYDDINDWFMEKHQSSGLFDRAADAVRRALSLETLSPGVANVLAEFTGDIIWPVLLAEARDALRTNYLNQLRTIIADGERAGHDAPFQRITLMAHSMGCFHTYETLCEAATNTAHGLSPGFDGVVFENVIYFASPVQLIRHVAGLLGPAVPQPQTLHCLAGPKLDAPHAMSVSKQRIESARNTVTITGNLDPVGGHLFRKKLNWAYMDLPGAKPFIDAQQLGSGGLSEELTLSGMLDLAGKKKPVTFTPENPHDWPTYFRRHKPDIVQWLTG